VRAGKLNKIATFRRKTIAYDGYNTPIETWADAMSLYTDIITTGGREFYAAQKVQAETTALIRLRYNSKINELMRVEFGNATYEILAINNVDQKNKELRISVKEVT